MLNPPRYAIEHYSDYDGGTDNLFEGTLDEIKEWFRAVHLKTKRQRGRLGKYYLDDLNIVNISDSPDPYVIMKEIENA